MKIIEKRKTNCKVKRLKSGLVLYKCIDKKYKIIKCFKIGE